MSLSQYGRSATLVAVLAGAVVLADSAAADDPAPAAIDIGKVKSSLTVLHDGAGHYLVVGDWKRRRHMYWGDGATFHKLRLAGAANSRKTKTLYYDFWAPRDSHARITQADKAWSLRCSDRTTELEPLAKKEAAAMLGSARFHAPIWSRTAHALYRDPRGTYYYVDRLLDAAGDPDYRLYVGRRGALQQMDGVRASGSDFLADGGELRVADDGIAEWVEGDTATTLRALYPTPLLIYRDLGLHTGDLGVPCDTL